MKRRIILAFFLAIFVISMVFLVHNITNVIVANNEVQQADQEVKQAEKELLDAYAECISYPENAYSCNESLKGNPHSIEVIEKQYGNIL